ncbi:MAG: hypothetical protein C0505_04045 [Leptothrix sp. (in: Bacteria)]|nr:hypothetical protein [Leptothrix sp. (in: b-proteobacteria)]
MAAAALRLPRSHADGAPAFRGGAPEPSGTTGSSPALLQRAPLRVSSPRDSAEQEAVQMARRVVQMPALQTAAAPGSAALQRAPLRVQRSPDVTAASDTGARIQAARSGGTPLPRTLRQFMEPRFGADFGAVRLHADGEAAALSQRLQARAFTVGEHIYFGRGQFNPETSAGRELIAHELAHTVQQGAATRQPKAQRSAAPTLTAQPAGLVQRLGLADVLDGMAALAANVPGYTLLTLIIGRNPINLRAVERNAANLLRAFMGLIPGGELLYQVLQRQGVVARLGAWVAQQTAELGLNFQAVRSAFTQFTDTLGWSDIFSPGDVWQRARAIFTPLIARVTGFVSGLVRQALTWLKDTFMEPLAGFCRQIPGYGLVTVMLGRDPFTNAPVPRTAMTVVRGLAELIPGGSEKFNQLVESGALARAHAWFIQETQARNLTWARVTGTFAAAWAGLQLSDALHPIDTLRRMVGLFTPLLSDLVGFAGASLVKLLELVYEAAMGAGGRRILALLTRARATFVVIIRDPVGFLRNLLGAVGQGVRQFMRNILTHLRDGVIRWLTGPVAAAGVRMPERWDLPGIIGFVLQILGLTWARVRSKLVNLMGERVVGLLEGGMRLLQDVRERGLVAALRERVTEFFGTLGDSALGAIRSFIQQRLVMAGITQLLSMLNPVGAVIQAIIKTYTTLQFFVQRMNQILELVESVVISIASIAAGAMGAAAGFVERTMARTIPVILDFLARFIGLGDVAGQVTATLRRLQGAVDGMLDRAVDWIRRQAASLASRALGGDAAATPQQRLENGLREGTAAVNRLSGSRVGLALISPVLAALRLRHNLRRLDAVPEGEHWAVVGEVNPRGQRLTQKLVEEGVGRGRFTSRVTFSAVNSHGWGTRMVADPIGNDKTDGTVVSDSLRGQLRARIGSRQGLYRLGHLLNHHIGGPGNDWRNLTPITPSANGNHLAAVERSVKGLVQAGRWVRYEVRVSYSGAAPAVPARAHALEGEFARHLAWNYQLLRPRPSRPTELENDPAARFRGIAARGRDTVANITAGYP